MKFDSKLVSFNRSADYVHHRALKNLRDNNLIDALELMRHAVERSPENHEYQLDLAEIYCELGCHELSNRILLDMIARGDAPAECYYGLALNQYNKDEYETAQLALNMYDEHAQNDAHAQEAFYLRMELDRLESARHEQKRKAERALRISMSACTELQSGDPNVARMLFEKSLVLAPRQAAVRGLYAMALYYCGNLDEAMQQAEACAAQKNANMHALCLAAEVMDRCGDAQSADRILDAAMQRKPSGIELRLLCNALCEMHKYDCANECLKAALRDAPYDKELLHLRAVSLHRSGAPDSKCEPFWHRILRINPEDSVASYYHKQAQQGKLHEIETKLVYRVPDEEHNRRGAYLLDVMSEGIRASVTRWNEDPSFRELMLWAIDTEVDCFGRAAVMVLVGANDELSKSILRTLMLRGDVPLYVKLHVIVALHMRGLDADSFLPPGMDAQDGFQADSKLLMQDASVGERQLVRLACSFVEHKMGTRPLAALMSMWNHFKKGLCGATNPLNCMEEAAAALAWNYLLSHKKTVRVHELIRFFSCNSRRLFYFAQVMAEILDMTDICVEDGHEDH